jgi:outer membrane protein TolC
MNPRILKTALTVFAVAACFLAIGRIRTSASTAPAPDTRSDVVSLRQERVTTLRKAGDIVERLFASGTGTFEQVERTDRQLVDAELALATTPAQRADILNNAFRHAEKQEAVAQQRVKAGLATTLESLEAKAYRLSLEIRLSDAGADEGQHR